MRRSWPVIVLALALLLAAPVWSKSSTPEEDAAPTLEASDLAGLSLRNIGPALMSGRIGDLAIHPEDTRIWYAAVASGGVWKTTNAGISWTPIFDGEGSYSIGCITLDPRNPEVVWVGTGENNSQRSVGYGDGVYKSVDGGRTWQHVGLADSEHIGMITIDPRDSDVVYVAAQGPLWAAGGERGLYKTSDGGATWALILEIDEHTGVSEVLLDPRDPDVVYAASYQRRRRVWTLINGGPGSAVHKSTDGGASWTRLGGGLPGGELGRIGLAMSPADPNVLYAVIEASEDDKAGFYRSADRGASWTRKSDYVTGSPQYYQELIADPHDVDRVYAMDTWMQVTEDGGASFRSVPETYKHVDNHALWIDPENTDHLIAGCDGGIYESFDRGATWRFVANLPVTQFYKIAVDDDQPFYNVYGGTQDNFTLGGPSRTHTAHGITNADWFVTHGGDGFQPRIDPTDPDIVYAQSQYAGLVRFDRRSGEEVDIQPMPAKDDPPLRWNWDAPLIISPHDPARLYFGAQRLFRSDNRGDDWRPVSGDLTRNLDRNTLEVMGKVWHIDAVSKNRSTSFYGTLVALAESPRVEGLLYTGSDDGLVQVSEDGGESWRKEDTFPGVPERTYVNALVPSQHDDDTVYALFNNHKSGDFAPYVLKSSDRGRSWTSISSDLPERGSSYSLVEDHEQANLLFVGTEFGVFTSVDGGGHWVELTGGMPTIAVRDLQIQRRENDLVVGTFGRGILILDDYTPLRHITAEALDAAEATLYPVKKALSFYPSFPLGLREKSFQGDGFFTAPNPPYGAVFTYHLRDGLETREDRRKRVREEAEEAGESVPYPSWDALREEAHEDPPIILLTVEDAAGQVIRRIEGPSGKGIHRVSWDLRFPPAEPARLSPYQLAHAFDEYPRGPRVVPGTYRVTLAKRVDGALEPLGAPRSFEVAPLGNVTLEAPDKAARLAFQQKVGRLQHAVSGAIEALGDTHHRLQLIKAAIDAAAAADPALRGRALAQEATLAELEVALLGDRVVGRRSEPTSPSIAQRVGNITYSETKSSSPITGISRDSYQVASDAFAPVLASLRTLIDTDLPALEAELDRVGAPYTPGRLPTWQPE